MSALQPVSLEQFPLELLSIIINLLDFKSCLEFCKTNHFFNYLVRELLKNLIIPPIWYYDLIKPMVVGGRWKYAWSSTLNHVQPGWYFKMFKPLRDCLWYPSPPPCINPEIAAKFPNIKNIIDYSERELDSPIIVISKQERLKLIKDNKVTTNQDFATKVRNEYNNSVRRPLFKRMRIIEFAEKWECLNTKMIQNALYGFSGAYPLFAKKRYIGSLLSSQISSFPVSSKFHQIQKEKNKTRKLWNKKQNVHHKFMNKNQNKCNKCNKRANK